MQPKIYFITGISTEVGKTIAAAILVEALQADYWKPIQAGDLNNSDTHKVKNLISNTKSQFYDNAYALKTPMSPDAAAKKENITINEKKIIPPQTNNTLIIEGAGGILVPLNNSATILNIIKPNYHVILVSRHYLGSINHTLLSLQILEQKGYAVSLIFNGNPHPETEQSIRSRTNAPVLGRIKNETKIDKACIKKYAAIFKGNL